MPHHEVVKGDPKQTAINALIQRVRFLESVTTNSLAVEGKCPHCGVEDALLSQRDHGLFCQKCESSWSIHELVVEIDDLQKQSSKLNFRLICASRDWNYMWNLLQESYNELPPYSDLRGRVSDFIEDMQEKAT